MTLQDRKKFYFASTSLSSITPLALEPRFMFDAAGAATGVEAAQDAAAHAEADKAVHGRGYNTAAPHDTGGSNASDLAELIAAANGPATPRERTDVVVVDTTVSGYQDLVAGLAPGTDVVLIDGSHEGLADLAASLAGRTDIDSLYIVSHGDTGLLSFGTDVLTGENVNQFADTLAAIGATLSADGDILLYGCRVGESGQGLDLVNAIAALTGADVAASDDTTGAGTLGGDWDLEITTGNIESDQPFSNTALADFSGILAYTGTFDFESSTGYDSGLEAVTQTLGGYTLVVDGADHNTTISSYDGYTHGNSVYTTTTYVYGQPVPTESQLTISFTNGETFDISSLFIYNWNGQGNTETFTITSDKGDTFTTSALDDLAGASFDLDGFTGITQLYITSDGAFNIWVDDFAIANVTPASSGNTAPEVSGAPSSVTVTEDVETAINLSNVVLSDDDADTLTVTLSVDAGTLSAASSGSITIGGTSTALTLSGTASAINTYLDTTSNITYTSASNANGTAAATLTITPNDGTEDGTAATVSINITAVNDAPTFSGLDGTPSYTEGDAAVTLDSNVTITDIELDAANDYTGASLTIARNGGANADDSFSLDTGNGATFTVSGSNILSNGDIFATFSSSNGTLTIDFTGAGATPTGALVDDLLQHIQYSNSSTSPDASVQLDWSFNDGEDNGTGSTTVSVTDVNGQPTLSGLTPLVYVEDDGVVFLAPDASLSDVETDYDGATLVIGGVVSGETVTLNNAGTGSGQVGYSGGTITYEGVTVGTATGGSGSDFSITFNASATAASVQAVLQNITYVNTAETSSAGRALSVTFTDADGDSPATSVSFSVLSNGSDPLNGLSYGAYASPAFADLDDDGDLDMIVGINAGTFVYYRNEGTDTAPSFVKYNPGNATNPMGSTDIGNYSTTALVDIDYDGDYDLFVGRNDGTIQFYRNDGTASAPSFVADSDNNPLSGVDVGTYSTITFADIDGDGDQDAFIGGFNTIQYYRNIGDAANPSFSIVDSGSPIPSLSNGYQSPTFGDFDADGDLDLVVGRGNGSVAFYENTGTGSSPTFTSGTNPFSSASLSSLVRPAVADLDGDGDLEVVFGRSSGGFAVYENNSVVDGIAVTIYERNDAPTFSATGATPSFTEGDSAVSLFSGTSASTVESGQSFEGLTLTVTNVDGTDAETLSIDGTSIDLTDSNSGTTDTNSLTYSVSVSGGTATVTLTGGSLDASALATLVDAISYRNTSDDPTASGTTRVITITEVQDDGANAHGGDGTATPNTTATVTITPVNDPATFSMDDISYTEGDGTVFLDANVVFTDVDGGFDGATLVITGLLSEDTVAVNNEGTASGEIGVSGSDITYGGTTIATFSGGAGTSLTITFNSSATQAAVEALMQNLTYANSSDEPTASRSLSITYTDADGVEASTGPSWTSASSNPIGASGFNVSIYPSIASGDFDNDGDIDIIASDDQGEFYYFRNDGTALVPSFTRIDNASGNPLQGISFVTPEGSPSGGGTLDVTTLAVADIDNDGDLDIFVGLDNYTVAFLRNDGTASAPSFTEVSGSSNPLNAATLGKYSAVGFVDIDDDGDLDALIGSHNGMTFWLNGGTASSPSFSQVTDDSANPFSASTFAGAEYAAPTFADFDNDGDFDLLMSQIDGTVHYYENTGTASSAVFVERTGSDLPFTVAPSGLGFNRNTVGDFDNDGDLDLVVTNSAGTFEWYENTPTTSLSVDVTVTAVNDVPTLTATAADPSFTEGDSAVALFTDTSASTVESGQFISGMVLTVTNVDGTSDESITFNGATISLATGAGFTDDFNYSVSVSGGVATVTFSNASVDTTSLASLVNGMTYANTSDDPTSTGSTRVITITSLTDNGADGTAALSIASTVSVTAVNDAPSGSTVPATATFTEDTAGNLDLSGLTLADADSGTSDVTLTLTATNGTMAASDGGGVVIAGSGTSEITLTGTISEINTYLDTASNIQYTGAANANGTGADSIALTLNDGGNTGTGGGSDVDLGTISIDITSVNDVPTLSGLTAIAYTEGDGTVFLDTDVSFSDVDENFDGGTLVVSGVLAEETLSINDAGTDAGQIGFDGT
ncbi:MAG: DUF4347 domain-containing protein, partial [Alphaproteobacteria bacterium]